MRLQPFGENPSRADLERPPRAGLRLFHRASARRISRFLLVWLVFGFLRCAFVTAASLQALEEQEARLDATLWQGEIQALEHERTFFRLRDDFRAATNRLEVLAQFPFDRIRLPTPQNTPEVFRLGLVRVAFPGPADLTLSRSEWADTLRRLSTQGWRLEQSQWSHERFSPASGGRPAVSEFRFTLHGQRLAAHSRFTVEGDVAVEWADAKDARGLFTPGNLTVTNLSVIERSGEPGFRQIGVVTPSAPERHGDLVDLHPVVVTDVDGDGDDDVVMAGVNQLFRNRGDATFEPQPFIAETNFHGARVTGVIGDFEGDGQPDFVTVASQGTWSNQLVLYVNRGVLPFNGEPRLACPEVRAVGPAVLTAGDIDRDGDLDLWLGQYKQPFVGGQMPTPYYDANDGFPSFLLINDGQGRFTVGTAKAGLAAKANRRMIAASFVDLDADGHLDLLTVNDFSGVDLFLNQGGGRFVDASRRLYNRISYGMTHCFGDFDRDGQLDFLVAGMYLPTVTRLEALRVGRDDLPEHTRKRADMAYGNRVYLGKSGRWERAPFEQQLARTGWTWGTAAADFDRDGTVDFYLANGQISGASVEDTYDSHYWRHDIYLGTSRPDPELFRHFAHQFADINTLRTSYNGHQANCLFLDVGTNRYTDVAYLMNVAQETDCRAVIGADLDNDGRMDLLVTESEWFGSADRGRNRLLLQRNVLTNDNHWIGIRLDWGKGGVSPFGAKVTAKADGRTFHTQLATGTSYHCQGPNTALFGLGRLEKVDTLTVVWPNGESQSLVQPAVDRYHRFAPR